MRSRRAVSIVPFLVLLVFAASALGVHTQTGPSHALLYKGSDAKGPVTFQFSYIDQIHQGGRTTHMITLDSFRFADGCAARGSKVPGSIKVAAGDRFDYHSGGFTVKGRLIGGSYQPRKITGSARVVTAGCDSGALAFSAKLRS